MSYQPPPPPPPQGNQPGYPPSTQGYPTGTAYPPQAGGAYASGGYQLGPVNIGLSGAYPPTGYQQPPPPAGYQQPPPPAGYQQPPAGYQQPTAGYQPPPAYPQSSYAPPPAAPKGEDSHGHGHGRHGQHHQHHHAHGQAAAPPPPAAPILYFHICSKLNGLVLDIQGSSKAPGTKVVTWSKKTPPADNQLWYEDPSVGAIRAKLHGFCLDISGDALVVNPYKQGNKNQLWFLSGDRIQNRKDSNKVLDIANKKTEPGARVCAYKFAGEKNQLWKFEYQKKGHTPQQHAAPAKPVVRYFYIRSEMNNKVLDIRKGSAAAGSDVIMYSQAKRSHDNQLWYRDENGTIRSKLNNMAIDTSSGQAKTAQHKMGNKNQLWTVSGNRIINMGQQGQVLDIKQKNTDDGAVVVPYAYNGGINQHWHIDFI